jgi:transcriptional regulator with XRE-family HTH domain
MGYRGKVVEQEQARLLRAEGLTLAEIAARLGVAKSSVSLWTRGVRFTPRPRQRPTFAVPNKLHLAKLAEIEAMDAWGKARIGVLGEEAFFAAGAALYAGEGAKADGKVHFANTDAGMVRFFCAWLRRYFDVDEARLRASVYLHAGLDLDAAEAYWSVQTGVPRSQFGKAYRAVPDPSIRRNKHAHGCVYVSYACARVHRAVMGSVRALLSSEAIPG